MIFEYNRRLSGGNVEFDSSSPTIGAYKEAEEVERNMNSGGKEGFADLMFIIRATNLVSIHNRKLGGSQRERLLTYTKMCL